MLKDKALENLAAGEELLDRGRMNAAASRLYYAMFQAAVHRFATLGVTPEHVSSGADRWQHAMVANNARALRGRDSDRDLYRRIMKLRVRADYDAAAVASFEIEWYRSAVHDFVKELAS